MVAYPVSFSTTALLIAGVLVYCKPTQQAMRLKTATS